MEHVHLIGIGGSGLSAIAQVLLESGYTVSGSDRRISPLARRLEAAGARVYAGHHPENLQGASLVVRSSAIPDDNVEVQAALGAGIPVLKRAEFLGRLLVGRRVIAVAGTHGKTTTTAMIAWILSALKQDPSFIIGGVSANLGGNAHAGLGPDFVIEADEYDRMFLGLHPDIAVVTNVEHDHPDCYPTPEEFYQAFLSFSQNLTPQGTLLACAGDPGAARLLRDVAASGLRVFSYGLEGEANGTGELPYACLARNLALNGLGGFTFEVASSLSPESLPAVSLRVPGRHNVRNALASLAVASLLGLSMQKAVAALAEFRGTGRRFELRTMAAGVTVIDDYAHHPTEIRATLAAARVRYPGRPLWAVWQPHTYSRTRALLGSFASAFGDADHVLVTGIYPAREPAPPDGFSSRQVLDAMQHSDVRWLDGLERVRDYLLENLRSGDVVLVLSAGDADQVSTQLVESLQALERAPQAWRKTGA